MGDLQEKIGATDNILSALQTQPCQSFLHSIPDARKQIDERLGGLFQIARHKMFQSQRSGFVRRFELRRDARMTGAKLAVAADRTADRDHWQSTEPNPVGTQAHQLENV